MPAQQTDKFPEKAKTQLIQEQKPPPSLSTKTVEDTTSSTQALVANSEKDKMTEESKVCKPVEIEVKPQESKDGDSPDTSSVSPMEVDPLATEEACSNTTAEKSSSSMENVENQASSTAVVKSQEDSSESSSQEKNTNENVQEPESLDQPVISKSNEPVSISLKYISFHSRFLIKTFKKPYCSLSY